MIKIQYRTNFLETSYTPKAILQTLYMDIRTIKYSENKEIHIE